MNLGLLHCRWILYHLNHQGSLALTNSHGTNQRNDKVTKAETFRSGSGQILQLISVLQIPESASSAFITVQVQGPTQNFIKRKPIYIRKEESLVFVQTDKPIYKPGQTGIRNQTSKGNLKGWRCGSLLPFGNPGTLLFVLSSWISTGGFHEKNLCVSVKFRIVSMDVNFHPLNETVSLITMAILLLFSRQVVSDSLQPHELQYTSFPVLH